jgi:putative ABC transport system ATP-binding protein
VASGAERSPAVFDVKGLTKIYKTSGVTVHALRGVDFSIAPGELVVLLGASGSGKSTLLNILGGLDKPSSGEVLFQGRDLVTANESELTDFRRHHVGFIFQLYNLVPNLTALENVDLVTDIADTPIPSAEALAMVAMSDRQDHFPAQLSGGEQQRVAVARAIAKRPEILLCDEPTGALDSHTGILVLEAIENVNQQYGTATIIITHNVDIAEMADRVVRLADGEITEVRVPKIKKSAQEISW